MTTLFTLRSIRKFYRNNIVLDLEHLDIHQGRCYLLTGQNGAGKSTLLNILAFLSPPTSGDISFEGHGVDWKSRTLLACRQKVTLLHQSPYLFAGTVFANVAYGLNARKIPHGLQQQLVDEALDSVGLSGFQARPVQDLSGGEAQRVAMARALILKPLVLLLDEPFSSVDRKTAEMMESILASLPQGGTTVIMATHEPSREPLLFAESIHLVQGKLAGSPQVNCLTAA
ncbi:energy-coupling factor ABC transporter ATP-binding protein [Geotalea toluenoxydans]